jgi:hypothetical protein
MICVLINPRLRFQYFQPFGARKYDLALKSNLPAGAAHPFRRSVTAKATKQFDCIYILKTAGLVNTLIFVFRSGYLLATGFHAASACR